MKVTVRFGNGMMNGGRDVWETLALIIPSNAYIESVSSHDGVWTAIVEVHEPEPDRNIGVIRIVGFTDEGRREMTSFHVLIATN